MHDPAMLPEKFTLAINQSPNYSRDLKIKSNVMYKTQFKR